MIHSRQNAKPLNWPAVMFTMAAMLFAIPRAGAQVQDNRLTLWYDHPAKVCMDEALPVGNGRLGGLILGDPGIERIVLNEDSLWTGNANPSGDYGDDFGAYQKLGELIVTLPGHESPTHYRRDLDISRALAHVSYELDGVHYQREVFASSPAQVLVVRFTADKPGQYTGSIALQDGHDAPTVADGHTLMFASALPNGLKYESQLLVINTSGVLRVEGSKINFSGCDALTFVLAARTDYVMDASRHFRGDPPHERVTADLAGIA
jgi:alpha-L-fucosidase 2